MKHGINPARSRFGVDDAVHIGLDPLRIAFIAVQYAVRNAGAIESFECTQQNPARAAALANILPERHRRTGHFQRWRGLHVWIRSPSSRHERQECYPASETPYHLGDEEPVSRSQEAPICQQPPYKP